jgi:hypothetical protein
MTKAKVEFKLEGEAVARRLKITDKDLIGSLRSTTLCRFDHPGD